MITQFVTSKGRITVFGFGSAEDLRQAFRSSTSSPSIFACYSARVIISYDIEKRQFLLEKMRFTEDFPSLVYGLFGVKIGVDGKLLNAVDETYLTLKYA